MDAITHVIIKRVCSVLPESVVDGFLLSYPDDSYVQNYPFEFTQQFNQWIHRIARNVYRGSVTEEYDVLRELLAYQALTYSNNPNADHYSNALFDLLGGDGYSIVGFIYEGLKQNG